MRLPSSLVALALAAAPVAALDLIELKSGKVLEVEEASIRGDKLHVQLATPPSQTIAYSIPIERVIPEFVFYVWVGGLEAGDVEAHHELAAWARENGLFSHALRIYEITAGFDPEFGQELPQLKQKLHEEEATWHFVRAEELFGEDEVEAARVAAETVLDRFSDTAEVGRAKELLNIIKEREQFLTEEKLREERARRARKQKRIVDRYLYEVGYADRLAEKAHLRYVHEARWRLRYAGHYYTRAAVALSDLLPFIEVDELRRMVEGHLAQLEPRITRTLIRLADLRYLEGDLGGALDAIHQVLDIEPDNHAAVTLRDRILDGPGPTHVRYKGGFLTHRRRLHHPFPYYGAGGRLRFRPIVTLR